MGPRTLASAEVRTQEGKLSLFVAIDRTSRLAVARLHAEATRPTACQVLEALLEAVPCRIHTLLADRAIKGAIGPGPMARGIRFGPGSPATATPSSRA